MLWKQQTEPIKRIAHTSSMAAHSFLQIDSLKTLYELLKCVMSKSQKYIGKIIKSKCMSKTCNSKWCGRDQGMTSKQTVAMLAAALGQP